MVDRLPTTELTPLEKEGFFYPSGFSGVRLLSWSCGWLLIPQGYDAATKKTITTVVKTAQLSAPRVATRQIPASALCREPSGSRS